MTPPVSRLASATKVYYDAEVEVTAVKGAELSVQQGEAVCIVGPSGSGKSTLLSLMGALRLPTSGEALFEGQSLGSLTSEQRRQLRLREIGFVFQQLRLVPSLTVTENVMLPMALLGVRGDAQLRKSAELLRSVGLSGKERRRPGQLSVGEQQRAAVARALVNDPRLVLADEPTSQLDTSAGIAVVELLRGLSRDRGAAVVVSTHDQKIGESFEKVYGIRDGVLQG